MFSVKINCHDSENYRVYRIDDAQNKFEASVYAVERYFAEHTHKKIKSILCNDEKISKIDLVVSLASEKNPEDFDEIIDTLKTLKQISDSDRDVNRVKRLKGEISQIKLAMKKIRVFTSSHSPRNASPQKQACSTRKDSLIKLSPALI